MFAADTHFEFGFGRAAFFHAHSYELANAFLIEHFERIGLDDSVFFVEFEELGSIVARESEGHLGKVVGTEREEVGYGSNLISYESSTGNLDHGTYFIGYALSFFLKHLGGSDIDDVCLVLDFLEGAYERNHDFREYFDTASLNCKSGLNDGTGLHFGDLRIGNAETASAMTEHGVEFLERIDFCLYFFKGKTHFVCELFLRSGLMGYEFVHSLENAFEVTALHGKQFGESMFAAFNIARKNHFADGFDAVTFKEHVFGAAETDTFSAEVTSLFGIAGCIGVSAYAGGGKFGCEVHD